MRRRATPVTPHITPSTAGAASPPLVGMDRGRPAPPPPPPELARVFVYNMMIAGAGREQIAATDAALNQPPWGRDMVLRIYSSICRELGDAALLPEHTRENLRAASVDRLRRDLVLMRIRRDNLPEKDHRTFVALMREIRHHESLLADVEGTKQLEIKVGVDVDVRVRSASMRVIANLTRDDFAELGRQAVAGALKG